MSRKLLLTAIAATAVAVSPSLAQDFTLNPAFGQVTLNAGFTPDPHSVGLVAGGNIEANSAIGGNCYGSIADAPDYRLNYSAGGFPLIISVLSSDDTTLVINGPDGQWYCDDDSGGNLNPLFRFDSPSSGQYDIWVGTFGGGTANATLNISEVGGGNAGPSPAPIAAPGAAGPDFTLSPAFGQVNLNAGFTPDPHTVNLVADGNISANAVLGGSCAGSIAEAPDYRLQYSAGGFPLIFSVLSNNDTTLVINGPDGQWYCDDDSGGSLNPLVHFDNPSSGQYDIWVGTFSDGTADATLNISEVGGGYAGGGAAGPNFNLPPAFGTVDLAAGFSPQSIDLVAGGDVDASSTPGNDAEGNFCVGMIAEAPDYRVQFSAGNAPLIFTVMSSEDTTLIINAPDGSWYCNDDGAGYPNPEIAFGSPLSGQYDVWVGAYSGGNPNATLQISQGGGK